MGKASQRKVRRRQLARARPDLERKLRGQHENLTRLGRSYDDGWEGAAFLLAVSLRVLLHDTPKSVSLLAQVDLKDRLRFKDTAVHIDPTNELSNPGLVMMELQAGSGARFVPPLGDRLSPPRMHPDLLFGTWWTMPVTSDAEGHTWSRKTQVLQVANEEGGAHIDPLRDEDLRRLEEENTMGWAYTDPWVGAGQPMLNGPTLPSVRQIAYEVQATLEDQAGHLLTAA